MKQAFFTRSVGSALLMTAAVKLIAASGDEAYLAERDLILSFLTNRQVLLVAALVELLVVQVLVLARDNTLRLSVITWLSSVFVAYHVGLWLIGYTGPCKCLGFAGDWFHLTSRSVDWIVKAIVLYMIGGSCYCLLTERRSLAKV